jgi:hypothetical protein
MRNYVSFRSSRFENKIVQPHFINAICFGEDLAAWLLTELRESPWNFSAPIQEDYGWGFWVNQDFWVAISIMDDSIGAEIAEWLLSVEYDAGLNLKKRLFAKPDRTLQAQICTTIHSALGDSPDITEIRWCDDGERDCGDAPS